MKRSYHFSERFCQHSNRTKYLKIRITSEQDEHIRNCALLFHGDVSYFIRCVIDEYSIPITRKAVDYLYDLYSFYFYNEYDLSLYGSDLNQSVKRANELAKAGMLTAKDIEQGPLQNIKSLRD